MIATEVEIARVPLCPMHFTRMKACEVWYPDPVTFAREMTSWFYCAEIDCNYAYSLSRGYFRFRKGEPIESEESLRDLCRIHHHPLYISEYGSQSKIAIWRCPEARCKTNKKSAPK
jgi:hypothetical protein